MTSGVPSPFVGREPAQRGVGSAWFPPAGLGPPDMTPCSPVTASSHPGRVARAGRSGTAYSLVAPDEVPYLLDLHLFLGRALSLAHPQEEPSGEWRQGRGQCGRGRAVLALIEAGPDLTPEEADPYTVQGGLVLEPPQIPKSADESLIQNGLVSVCITCVHPAVTLSPDYSH